MPLWKLPSSGVTKALSYMCICNVDPICQADALFGECFLFCNAKLLCYLFIFVYCVVGRRKKTFCWKASPLNLLIGDESKRSGFSVNEENSFFDLAHAPTLSSVKAACAMGKRKRRSLFWQWKLMWIFTSCICLCSQLSWINKRESCGMFSWLSDRVSSFGWRGLEQTVSQWERLS